MIKNKTLNLKLKNYKKGFTLIELLIVIVIIGILATLLMANFIGVRQRARDAQRKSDLRQIQSALEIYRSDNGGYPNSSALLTPNYMAKIPNDPLGSGYQYVPEASTTPRTYNLFACLENANDSQSDAQRGLTPAIQSGCSVASYTLTQP